MHDSIMHFELVPNGHAIRAKLYYQQLERVYEYLKQKYLALINQKCILIQQDNAKPHTSRKTKDKFKELGSVDVLPHPAYSPDYAPSVTAFSTQCNTLKGLRFDSFSEVEEVGQEFFDLKLNGTLTRSESLQIDSRKSQKFLLCLLLLGK